MATPAKIFNRNLPTVALVGRVNVGKSTLFNRLSSSQKAIVSPIPGTTRTRNIANTVWRGKEFSLVDTGGLTFSDDIVLEKEIVKQTEAGLRTADLIIFICDIQSGILPQEKELAKMIRQKFPNKPVLLVLNKADSEEWRLQLHNSEWRRLGLGEPTVVSALNGARTGDLLDLIYQHLRKIRRQPKLIKEIKPIKVALLGKPNVGKSSLFNKLIGEDRVIVSDLPHTTREPHDTLVEVDKKIILFIDTAGIRKKSKVSGALERLGIGKSLEAVKRCDIVLFLLDASEPITDQDKQLGGLLREHTKSVIIVVNKWDLAEDNSDSFRNEVKKLISNSFPHLNYAPIIFISALSGYKAHQIFPLIEQANAARQIVVPDEELQTFMKATVKRHLPSRGKGVRHPKILGLRQIGIAPPMFEMFIKYKTSVSISYVNFVKNRLRETYGFFATPLLIKLTKMKR